MTRLLYFLILYPTLPHAQAPRDSMIAEASLAAYLTDYSNFYIQEQVTADCSCAPDPVAPTLPDTLVLDFIVDQKCRVNAITVSGSAADHPAVPCIRDIFLRTRWKISEHSTLPGLVQCRRQFLLDRRNGLARYTACIPGDPAYHIPKRLDTLVVDIFDSSHAPSFPGGWGALYEWLAHFRAVDPGRLSESSVSLTFEVDRIGDIHNIQVARDSSAGVYARHACELVGHMPRWIPGQSGGRPVRMRALLTVKFYFPPENAKTDTLANSWTDEGPAPYFEGYHTAGFPGKREVFLDTVTAYVSRPRPDTAIIPVFADFNVEKDGRLTCITATTSAAGHIAGYGQETLRIVQQMPPWRPSREWSHPERKVRGRYTMVLWFPAR
ncbi:MAG: hypothetical protein EP344_00220 [Bacteroidetes bacterium]|nr:MAG: hypothetical protein EP344_00220 [Bacteroidota bacterium]